MCAAVVIVGDSLEKLKSVESESIRTCVSSPPYFQLRDYKSESQIGKERTPQDYAERLVAIFREVRRSLTPDGTLWLNIGDTFASKPIGKIKAKDLIGVPWLIATALRDDGWYSRSEVIWSKPNGSPESVQDRPTRSHEQIFLFSKSKKYFYNMDAVREPLAESSIGRAQRYAKAMEKYGTAQRPNAKQVTSGVDQSHAYAGMASGRSKSPYNLKGRNIRSVWDISLKHSKGCHFATFPHDLVERCILAGSEEGDYVLDPFSGSGTTGIVADILGRNYIGIEINQTYADMWETRSEEIKQKMKG